MSEKDDQMPYSEIQYKDFYKRTIEIPKRTHILKDKYCLKVHNVHLKLALPFSG